MAKPLDLVGQTFWRLYVVERVENDKHGKTQWLCICRCGNETIVTGSHLGNGNTKSCGCLYKETVTEGMRGSKNPMWKDGISTEDNIFRNSKEMREWRFEIYKRDNCTCQKCNERGGKLQAHHLLGFAQYPEARLIVDNGVTLCLNCHKEFHTLYGIKSFTPEDYNKYYGR